MSAVDAEVRIGREQDRIGRRLAHSDEARVGEAHRDVRILLHETQHAIEVVREIERRNNGTPAKKRTEGWPAARPQKVEGLRENSVARSPGRGQTRRVSDRPPVVTVATAQKGDDEAGVNENACGHTR